MLALLFFVIQIKSFIFPRFNVYFIPKEDIFVMTGRNNLRFY